MRIVPQSRLMLWVGAVVVPFAALSVLVPEAAVPAGLLIAAGGVMALLDAALALAELPRRGRLFRRNGRIRRIVHGNYLIVYRLNETEKTVEILRCSGTLRVASQGFKRQREILACASFDSLRKIVCTTSSAS